MRSLIAMLTLVVACGGGEPAATTPPPTTDTTAVSPTTTTGLSFSGRDVVEGAVTDLAGRLGVDPAEIEVVSAEAVSWSDGSLGCPEEGKMYTQALVDGYRVVLSHDGSEYDYHSGEDGNPFLCDRPSLGPGRDPSVTFPGSPQG